MDREDFLYSYILPFRDDGGGRLDNLFAVLEWIAPLERTQFLIVEQDKESCPGTASLPASVEHLFLFNPGPFNKSWGFNVGVKESRGEVLALADADILVDTNVVQACFDECREKFDAINPFSNLIDLDAERTEAFRHNGDLIAQQHEVMNRDYKGEYLCFCGGIYVIRKSSYLRLGGQDERFLGWGGEDDAMSVKISLLNQTATNRSGLAYHLFHEPPSAQVQNDPDYHRNIRLLQEYHRIPRQRLESLCRAQTETMGDPKKYENRR